MMTEVCFPFCVGGLAYSATGFLTSGGPIANGRSGRLK